MSMEFDVSETVDVKGASCPMPVVKTKQSFESLADGEMLEVVATDPGSMSDIAGWADSTAGAQLVDQVEDAEADETVFRHYVQRAE